jgi:hypothetical protein
VAQLKWFLCDHPELRKTDFVICDSQAHAAASRLRGKERIEDPARVEFHEISPAENPGG